jgi:heme-degrading monooxygenase HmoA
MFASVAKFRFTRPLTTADFETNERVLVPLLKSQPGYLGYFEVQTGERECISIKFWASQSDAEQGLAAIRPQVMEVFGSAMDGPSERSRGEVQYADPPA